MAGKSWMIDISAIALGQPGLSLRLVMETLKRKYPASFNAAFEVRTVTRAECDAKLPSGVPRSANAKPSVKPQARLRVLRPAMATGRDEAVGDWLELSRRASRADRCAVQGGARASCRAAPAAGGPASPVMPG